MGAQMLYRYMGRVDTQHVTEACRVVNKIGLPSEFHAAAPEPSTLTSILPPSEQSAKSVFHAYQIQPACRRGCSCCGTVTGF